MRKITIAPPLETGWIPLPLDGVVPDHGPRDPARLERLRKSMSEKGWLGFPVMVEAHAWNASHRLAVARELGFKEIPAVLIPSDWYTKGPTSVLKPEDSWSRLEYAKEMYGDTHPMTVALKIERGEMGGIKDFYETAL